ncbi:hypothetical protein WR25_01117 [Diploscapter pachys]|uniref:Beta-lactamase-related domain-containing protein n=1 Tax=Diploscapter pachys TaxID=2018661 RepID=A0A2A2LJ40_9BILA|nr:hypothetical protein WR25_01117 [Diploscapter pachys]
MTVSTVADDLYLAGAADDKYASLQNVFRENFELGLERAGAAFAVFKDGKLVCDLYGGTANETNGQKWTKKSMSVLFSTTKSISATVLAGVLNANKVSYDTKAGLTYSDEKVTQEYVTDWRKMSEYFEKATPVWTPGTASGYHALTIGFLFDQIVRRIDPQKRGLIQILNEDYIDKYDIEDLSIGLKKPCDNYRVARLRLPTEDEIQKDGAAQPIAFERYSLSDNIHNQKLYETWDWIKIEHYNLYENRLLPMPSNMGIGNARSLAQFHSLLATKSVFNQSFYDLLKEPVLLEEMDVVNQYEESKAYGYQMTKNPLDQWVFGHSGYGGQNVRVDVHNGLSYAYVTNELKIADADFVIPWKRLVDELYNIIKQT